MSREPHRLELLPASAFDEATLAAVFAAVYADYYLPLHVDVAAFRAMANWFDFDLGASRVARGEAGDEGIVIVATRGLSAWIGGMGVIPGRRRAGTGARLMRAAFETASAAGAHELWLEVLEQNAPAIALYERLGFRRERALEVWSFTAAPASRTGLSVAPIPVADAREFLLAHRHAREPWQRADATLDRMLEAGPVVEASAVREGSRLLGAGVHRAASGRVSVLQYAAIADRQADVAAALIAALSAPDTAVRLLNVPTDDPAAAVARSSNATREAGQIEMLRDLP